MTNRINRRTFLKGLAGAAASFAAACVEQQPESPNGWPRSELDESRRNEGAPPCDDIRDRLRKFFAGEIPLATLKESREMLNGATVHLYYAFDLDNGDRIEISELWKSIELGFAEVANAIDLPEGGEINFLITPSRADEISTRILSEADIDDSGAPTFYSLVPGTTLSFEHWLFDAAVVARELLNYYRMLTNTFTYHDGLDNGLARYLERQMRESQGMTISQNDRRVDLFLDQFPDLRDLRLNTLDFLFVDEMKIRRFGNRNLRDFYHGLARKAVEDYFCQPGNENLMRELQNELAAIPFDACTDLPLSLETFIEVGERISPGFRAWFEAQETFKEPELEEGESKRIVRAFYQGDFVHILHLEQHRPEISRDELDRVYGPKLTKVPPVFTLEVFNPSQQSDIWIQTIDGGEVLVPAQIVGVSNSDGFWSVPGISQHRPASMQLVLDGEVFPVQMM